MKGRFMSVIQLSQRRLSNVDVSAILALSYKLAGFMPGTGQPIVAPEALIVAPPHTVIIMNPIYRSEISAQLPSMGSAPEILTL